MAVDVDGDGRADYIVSGADRDGDGIPDALQQVTTTHIILLFEGLDGQGYAEPHYCPPPVHRDDPQTFQKLLTLRQKIDAVKSPKAAAVKPPAATEPRQVLWGCCIGCCESFALFQAAELQSDDLQQRLKNDLLRPGPAFVQYPTNNPQMNYSTGPTAHGYHPNAGFNRVSVSRCTRVCCQLYLRATVQRRLLSWSLTSWSLTYDFRQLQ